MVLEFLAWYRQQLRDCLPASVLRSIAAPDVVLVRAEPDGGIGLALRRGGVVSELGHADAHEIRRRLGRRAPATICLEVPPTALLERNLALPLAAEAEHRNLLRYEMDRYTPFTAQDVFWSTRVERRDRARGKLHVLLSVVPKAAIAATLERLAAAGLVPGRVEVAGAPGGVRAFELGGERQGGSALRLAAIGCAALAVAAVALPFLLQWQRSAAIEARIALLEPRVAEAAAIRRRIADRTTGASALATEEARLGDALGVLATVTQILPDDASLTGFGLRQRHLTLDGQAGSAAALIPLLAAAPSIRDLSFAAPVTRAGGGNAEMFSIRAEIVP